MLVTGHWHCRVYDVCHGYDMITKGREWDRIEKGYFLMVCRLTKDGLKLGMPSHYLDTRALMLISNWLACVSCCTAQDTW